MTVEVPGAASRSGFSIAQVRGRQRTFLLPTPSLPVYKTPKFEPFRVVGLLECSVSHRGCKGEFCLLTSGCDRCSMAHSTRLSLKNLGRSLTDPTTMPPFLPQELLDMIIDQLGRDILESPPGSRRRAHVHHLANYTLVCRDWMRRVSPYLFEHTYAKSERQLTTLLKSAKLSNRLSMNVNGLSLPTLPHPLDALRILDDIFLTFPHLRELAFSHCEWSYSQPVPALTFAQRHAIGVIRLGTWKHQTSFSFPGYLFAFKCIEILALTQLRAPVSLGRMDDSGQKLHVDSLCLESVVPGHIRSLAEMIEPSTLKRVSLLACSNHAELDALDSLLRSCGQRLQDLVIMLWNVAYLAEGWSIPAMTWCFYR